MAAIWRVVLDLSPDEPDGDFFELGGDSIAAALLAVRVRKEFGVDVPLCTLHQAGTVAALTRWVVARAAENAPPAYLTPLRDSGDRPPLFIVHGLGGELLCYDDLVRQLGPDQPVYGFRARVPAEGEPYAVSVEGVAADYVDELLRFRPAGPYRLAGYSLGGVVAFEMAQQLTRRGLGVEAVLVIDTRCPGRPAGGAWSPAGLLRAARNLPRWVHTDLLRTGPDGCWSRFRREVRALGRRLTGRHRPDVSDFADISRLPGRFQAVWRAQYLARRAYAPVPFQGQVWLFRARSQPLPPGEWHRPGMGWERLAAGGLTVAGVPGNHQTVIHEPNVRRLADEINRTLAGV